MSILRIKDENGNWQMVTSPTEPIKRVTFENMADIIVEDNTIYSADKPIQYLAITCPPTDCICHFTFTIADKDEDDKLLGYKIELMGVNGYIGKAPDFKNGETWELSIHNGIIASGKVVSE